MNSVAALVNDVATRDQPMLTWYGPDSERIDLTGRTAANWIIKAANLLALEADAHDGVCVWLDVPWHWRAIVWGLAAQCSGADVCYSPDGATIAVTNSPGDAHASMETIAIALPALAREVEDLPSWAIDGAADLMTQPDSWAFAAPAGNLTLTEVIAAGDPLAGARPTAHDGAPRLLILGDDLAAGLGAVTRAWAHGIGIVIADDEHVVSLEGATHVLTL